MTPKYQPKHGLQEIMAELLNLTERAATFEEAGAGQWAVRILRECLAAGFVTPEGEVIGASLRKAINNQCLNEIDDAYRWAYREARLGYKPKSSRTVKVRYGRFPACMEAYNEGRKHGEEDFNKAQEAARKAGKGGQ